MGTSRAGWAGLVLCLALLLSGCVTLVDPEASQQQAVDEVGVIGDGEILEQTFLARRPGLNGVALWVSASAAGDSPDGSLEIALYPAGDPGSPLERFSLSQARIAAGSPVLLSFDPLPGPGGQLYTLRAAGRGLTARFLGRNADVHPYGGAALNDEPLAGDLAFRLSYDYGWQAVLTDLRRGLENLPLALPLAAALYLPGWLLLSWLVPGLRDRFDGPGRFLLSVGLSMAAVPLVLTWTTQLGLRWSRSGVLAAAAALLVLAALRLFPALRSTLLRFSDSPALVHAGLPALLRGLRCLRPDPTTLAFLGVLALSLFVRIAMVRDLSAPPWVDSVHHAAITRRILEEGAFPNTYAPYIEIETSRYHAGYHSLLAFYTALAGQEIDAAMLGLGQALNVLAAAGVYLFCTTLTGDRRAGLLAALLASLFTPMPAYYTSWGRYTQLAGLVIFPALFALLVHGLDLYELSPGPAARRARLGMILAAAAAGGGLFITHYRVAAFLGCLLAVYLPLRWLKFARAGGGRRRAGYDLAILGTAALVGIALTLPWWPDTLSGLFLRKIEQWSGSGEPFTGINWSLLNPVMGRAVLFLAGAGLAAGCFRRRTFPLVLAGWAGLMFFLAYLGPLGLPGGGFVNSTSVEITLFIPAASLAGYFLSRLLGAWQRGLPVRFHAPNLLALTGVALAFSISAARLQLPLLRESTFLFRNADRPALEWMERNLPRGEVVMINPFSWGYNLYAGQDGGFWISPLAGLKTMPPPVLYGLADDFSTARRINATVEQAMQVAGDPVLLAELLREQEIQYLFLGARGGVFAPDLLQESGEFERLYAQNGVWVFQVKP